MAGPADTSPPAIWYLGRDGQQFGPLSDPELKKLVELGHLRPTDLVWREGFPDWRSARILLPNAPPDAPPMPPPATAPTAPGPAEPQSRPVTPQGPAAHAAQAPLRNTGRAARPPVDDHDDDEPETRAPRRGRIGRWLKIAALVLFFGSTLSAAAWYAYPYRDRIYSMVSALAPSGGDRSLAVAPLAGFAADPAATDMALQKARLWQVLKRDFPDWYGARIKEAADMTGAKTPEAAVGEHLMKAVVALRRQHATDALSATAPRLKAIGVAFAENLVRLKAVSTDSCYGFVSTGETSAGYLKLINEPAHTSALQAQLVAVFEAIGEGRKVPRVYPQPRQTDYNLLVAELEARGWTNADLKLFSDSQALSKAPPDRVCKMVTDWFQAQLAVKDDDAQLRLLIDALKPVIAG